LTWRLRLVAFARRLAVCWLGALTLAALLVAADRAIYLGLQLVPVVLALCAAATFAALVWAVGARITRTAAAARADAELGLSDRLASAAELTACERSSGGVRDGWADAVSADALARTAGVDPSRVFPMQVGLAGRLLAPAAVLLAVLWALPPLDLAGRMERQARRLAVEAEQAQRQRDAIDAAIQPGAAAGGRNGPGRLRLQIVRFRQQAGAGALRADDAAEASAQLRRLADALAEEAGDANLAEQLKRAAEALARDPAGAAKLLEQVERELAAMARALREADDAAGPMKRMIEQHRAELRTAERPDPNAGDLPPAGGPDRPADLVELIAQARQPAASTVPGGIVYARPETGVSGSAGPTHAAAVRAVRAAIDAGEIPARRVPLVRAYFDAVAPAE
jgi:hypothetical protein